MHFYSLYLSFALAPVFFTISSSALVCNRNDCLKQVLAIRTKAAPYCATYTVTVNVAATAFPTFVSSCKKNRAQVSSACSCLASISKIATIKPLPTTKPASVYNPPTVPKTYKGCVLDPTNVRLSFRLLDPLSGLPIINNNGLAQKTTKILTPVPEFRFVKTTVAGLYDLKLGNLFLAADLTGRAIFVTASTGSTYIAKDSKTYITSLFSYDCKGVLRIGIAGVVPFQMGYLPNNNQLFFQPNRLLYNPGTATKKARRDENLVKRAIDDVTRLNIGKTNYILSLKEIIPVVAPPPSYVLDPNDLSASRCPNSPTGLQVFDKPGSRPNEVNGCGSSGLSSAVPNLLFKSSCDNHDACFDTCSKDFAPCNDSFDSDLKKACYAKYSTATSALALSRWACLLTGQFYAWNVREGGRPAFASATRDRCECRCPTGQKECNKKCIPVLSDAQNCGACGVKCAWKCVAGTCIAPLPTTTTPPAPPPSSTDVCAGANFYNFAGSRSRIALVNDGLMWSTSMFLDYYFIEFSVETGLYDKGKCCRACYAVHDCFAYAIAPAGIFRDNKFPSRCTRFFPRKLSVTPLRPREECKMGGTDTMFYGKGEGGLRSLEPGPCAYNSEFGIGV